MACDSDVYLRLTGNRGIYDQFRWFTAHDIMTEMRGGKVGLLHASNFKNMPICLNPKP